VGAYSANNGIMFDVWTMLFFGILGYVFVKIRLSVVPFLIGFILGDDLEKYFVDSIKGAGGSLSVFFSRPMGWVIWGLIFASIAWAVYDGRREKKRAAGVCG
jgi:putative tricarboxylic transport membrane protein